MEKKILFRFLLLSVTAGLFFSSCKKDDDVVPKDDFAPTENLSVQDPEGTIVLNMLSGADGNYYMIGELGEIHVDAANNFRGNDKSSYKIEFVTIGRVDGLGKVNNIPQSGWAESAAVVPGTGYVMRFMPNYYYHDGNYGTDVQYARIYVVDYLTTSSIDEFGYATGSNSGAVVKYQAPFQLPFNVDETFLTFGSEAASHSVKMETPTIVEIEEKPEWCSVKTNSDLIVVSVIENLTASQRTGNVVLRNAVGTATLRIIQKASSTPLFENGSGTKADPYQINSAEQFEGINKALGSHFVLTADIDLKSYLYEYGNGWNPIGKNDNPFIGTLDGQGHTIKGLWIKCPSTNDIGLFSSMSGATISNLKVEIDEIGVTGNSYVGAIAGYSNNSNFYNCSINGKITGKNGGCVGGLCGSLDGGRIEECSVSGTVKGNGSSSVSYVGGLCGATVGTITIQKCKTEGVISNPSWYASGIVGYSDETCIIRNCYSIAALSGYYCNGISCGGTHNIWCYFAGKVSANYSFGCGGTYTYFDSTVSGKSGTNGLPTEEMMKQATYESWDFKTVWKITEGKTYPTLRCFDK